MGGFHKPTVATVVVIITVAFIIYHFGFGRKNKSKG